MIHSIAINEDFFRVVAARIKKKIGMNFSSAAVIVPNHRIAYLLKKAFDITCVLPRFFTIESLVEERAILLKRFDYVHFKNKAILKIHKVLKKSEHSYSIEVAARLFHAIANGEEINHECFNYIKQNFADIGLHDDFQRESIRSLLQDVNDAFIVGFNLDSSATQYLFETSLRHQHDIFVYGYNGNHNIMDGYFFHKLDGFVKQINIRCVNNNAPITNKIDRLFFDDCCKGGEDGDSLDNIKLIHCMNDLCVLLEVEGLLMGSQSSVAVVVEDSSLLQKLRYRLKRNSVELFYPCSFKEHLDALFLLHLLEVVINPDRGLNLIKVLKHPYIYRDRPEIVDEIENAAIRKLRIQNGWRGIKMLVAGESNLFLERFERVFELFKHSKNFAVSHIKSLSILTDAFLYAGKTILNFIANNYPDISNLSEYKRILIFFMNQSYYCNDSQRNDKVRVYNPREAMFLAEKTVVFLGFSEEHFSMDDMVVNYNLYQVFSKKSVYIVYTDKQPVARILFKIQNLFKIEPDVRNISSKVILGEKHKESDVLRLGGENLPNVLTATMLERLINSPYEFYLKHILKIREITEIDKAPSYADFGMLLHSILRECKNVARMASCDELMRLFDLSASQYYDNFAYVKFMWRSRFFKMARVFVDWNNDRLDNIKRIETEVELSINVKNINLKARFDRIEHLKDGSFVIIDFKSGALPTLKDVDSFVKPQLLIQALILEKSRGANISDLMYVKFGVDKFTEKKIKNIEDLISRFGDRMYNLIDGYQSGNIDFAEDAR